MMDRVFFLNIEFPWCGFNGVGVWMWDGFGMLLSDDWCTFFLTLNSLGWLDFSGVVAWNWDGFGMLLDEGWTQAG